MTHKENRQSADPLQLRGINRDQRTVTVVFTDFSLDSHGTRIDPDGWSFDQFKKNPVICLQHDSHGHSETMGLPIAKGIPQSIRRERDRWLIDIQFPEEGTFPPADYAFDLIADGFLNACSVGFMVEDYRDVDEDDGEGGSMKVRVFTKQTLMEISIVTIPSNDNALIQRAAERRHDVDNIRKKTQALEALLDATDEPECWSRSFSLRFNVADEKLEPALLKYDWVAKHIGCGVKEVFQNSFVIPPYRFGGFLSGLKLALAGQTLTDVRQLWGDREVPPEYRVIELNSRQSDDFLVDGVAFYRNDDGNGNLAYSISPTWGGLQIDLFTHRDAKDFNRRIADEAWRHATENNPLKGEAFSLSGEFIRATDETWDDCFLEEKNQKALTRMVERVNTKGKSTPNRGILMMGPPGTGKTLSGRIIRNTLKECSFIWVSSRDFHYGGFSQAFDLAREIAPAVIFFEDIDNYVSYNIDLLKTEMDGIARSTGVVSIMTTNFPEQLPEALIDRPGRFHDVLNFNLPTDDKRAAMLRKWVDGISDADVAEAVKQTKGYSGAHVYELASFTRNLMEADDLTVPDALREALKKIEEQKDLITKVQLQGSHYKPRRSFSGVRVERNAGTLDDMDKKKLVTVRITDLPIVQEKLTEFRGQLEKLQENYDKYESYFNNKQPVNRIASRAMKRFFEARGLEQPAEEKEAFERMEEIIEEEAKTEPEVKPDELKPEETPAAPEPAPQTPPAPEAPEPERKASVQVSLDALAILPGKMARQYVNAAVEALQRGTPLRDVGGLIDGLNETVVSSISPH